MTEDTSQASPVRRLEIDWVKTVAGALAAVSSAVLLSTLGAAGTIIGAALGSLLVTVGSALYGQGLERSRRRLAQAQSSAVQRVGAAQAEVRRAGRRSARGPAGASARSGLEHAERHLADARRDLDRVSGDRPPPGPPASWRSRLGGLPWRHVALVAAGLFVLAVLLITSFELLAGRSLASYTGGTHGTGGTTITRLGGSDHDSGPSPGPGGSTPPTGEPSGVESTTGDSSVPSPGPTTPTTPTAPSPTGPTPIEPSEPAPSLTPSAPPSSDVPSGAATGTPEGGAPAVPSP